MQILNDVDKEGIEQADFPSPFTPMLAKLTHDQFSDPDWIFERKLDGVRALAMIRDGLCRLYTRNKKEVGNTYPEVRDQLTDKNLPDCVLDGELVAFDGNLTSFEMIQNRIQVRDPSDDILEEVPVYYYVFDVVYALGYDLSALPLSQRKKVLNRLLSADDRIKMTEYRKEGGIEFYQEACRRKWEGLIAKRCSSRYVKKRSSSWLKFKCGNRQEFVIGGYTNPRGARHGFGALLLGYYKDRELRYAGNVGTGFDDAFLKEFHKKLTEIERKTSPFVDEVEGKDVHFCTPRYVGEVGFTQWTREGKLRHPRFLGIRPDKKPQEVHREDR